MEVVVDVHEPRAILDHLAEMGVKTTRRKISPGDYVIEDVGIERKTVGDFFNSMVQKRLFDQISRLRDCYPIPILIVEGDNTLIAEYQNPAALWGAILAITLDEKTHALFSPDEKETARIVKTIWLRKQKSPQNYGLRHKPKMLSIEERQRFILQGFPNVGEVLSDNLLKKFGSVRAVMQASKMDLMKVRKVGRKKAEEITSLLDEEYPGEQSRTEKTSKIKRLE